MWQAVTQTVKSPSAPFCPLPANDHRSPLFISGVIMPSPPPSQSKKAPRLPPLSAVFPKFAAATDKGNG